MRECSVSMILSLDLQHFVFLRYHCRVVSQTVSSWQSQHDSQWRPSSCSSFQIKSHWKEEWALPFLKRQWTCSAGQRSSQKWLWTSIKTWMAKNGDTGDPFFVRCSSLSWCIHLILYSLIALLSSSLQLLTNNTQATCLSREKRSKKTVVSYCWEEHVSLKWNSHWRSKVSHLHSRQNTRESYAEVMQITWVACQCTSSSLRKAVQILVFSRDHHDNDRSVSCLSSLMRCYCFNPLSKMNNHFVHCVLIGGRWDDSTQEVNGCLVIFSKVKTQYLF